MGWKPDFNWLWGKKDLVTTVELSNLINDIKKYYVSKEFLDDRLQAYSTTEEILETLANYLTYDEFNAFKINLEQELTEVFNNQDNKISQYKEEIKGLFDNLSSRIEEVNNKQSNDLTNTYNALNKSIQANKSLIDTNTSQIEQNKGDIASVTKLANDLVANLKKAKLWVQKGLWDANETYDIGNVVGVAEDKLMYVNVVANNRGNKPSKESTYWFDLSGVQSVDWDEFYTKVETDKLINDARALINTNKSSIDNLQRSVNDLNSSVSSNTNQISSIKTTLANKAEKSELNNCAKTNTNNTYASGARNIFNTLPEVWTEKTLPSKNTDLTTKKYVDDKFASVPQPDLSQCAKKNEANTFSGINTFNNTVNIGNTSLRHDTEHSLEIGFANGKKVYLVDGDSVRNGHDVATKGYTDSKVSKTYSEYPLSLNGWRIVADDHSGMSARFYTAEYQGKYFDKPYPVTFYTNNALSYPDGDAWYRRCFIHAYWHLKGTNKWYLSFQLQKIYDKNDDMGYYRNNLVFVVYDR